MATYDHKQVLSDYANGRITAEMAVGHGLQHIDHLYAAQLAARSEWRAEIDALKQQLTLTQATVERLQAVIDKARTKQKLRNTSGQLKTDQP
ncbi:MAG: hypothetical protein U0350_35570 [Caldilineaceae bacterium]